MTFDSEKIVYSLEDNWDELVSITFVNGNHYLSFSSLAYEDEIGVEFNDQVNCVSLSKSDFKFEFLEKSLRVILENPINQTKFSELDFIVHFPDIDAEKLTRAIHALIAVAS